MAIQTEKRIVPLQVTEKEAKVVTLLRGLDYGQVTIFVQESELQRTEVVTSTKL